MVLVSGAGFAGLLQLEGMELHLCPQISPPLGFPAQSSPRSLLFVFSFPVVIQEAWLVLGRVPGAAGVFLCPPEPCVCPAQLGLQESIPRGDDLSKAAQPVLISHLEQSWEFLWDFCSCWVDFLCSILRAVVHTEQQS